MSIVNDKQFELTRKCIVKTFIAPTGILPRGKIPRRHPYNLHVYKVKGSKVLTVKIYSIYTRSNLDLPEQGAHGISVMMTFHH